MNERCSFWEEKGNADKRGDISPTQGPQLLMHNEGLSLQRAQAFFSLLELPVMLMISSVGITWSISDAVQRLVITGTAEDNRQAVGFVILHVAHVDGMGGGAWTHNA